MNTYLIQSRCTIFLLGVLYMAATFGLAAARRGRSKNSSVSEEFIQGNWSSLTPFEEEFNNNITNQNSSVKQVKLHRIQPVTKLGSALKRPCRQFPQAGYSRDPYLKALAWNYGQLSPCATFPKGNKYGAAPGFQADKNKGGGGAAANQNAGDGVVPFVQMETSWWLWYKQNDGGETKAGNISPPQPPPSPPIVTPIDSEQGPVFPPEPTPFLPEPNDNSQNQNQPDETPANGGTDTENQEAGTDSESGGYKYNKLMSERNATAGLAAPRKRKTGKPKPVESAKQDNETAKSALDSAQPVVKPEKQIVDSVKQVENGTQPVKSVLQNRKQKRKVIPTPVPIRRLVDTEAAVGEPCRTDEECPADAKCFGKFGNFKVCICRSGRKEAVDQNGSYHCEREN